MKLAGFFAAPLLLSSLSAHPTDIAGAAFCAEDTPADAQACHVSWRWTSSPPQHQSLQRFQPANRSWEIVEETPGSQTGKSTEAVEPGHLYRLRACADLRLDNTCIESAVFWAPIQPKSSEEIPQVVVTPNGRILSVSPAMTLDQQTIQYNIYQLESILEGVDPVDLPPMTAPERRWGAKGFRAADNLTNNIYDSYSEARKSRNIPAVADSTSPKEFIADVPQAEWGEFRAKRVGGWPEQTMIVFSPENPKYTISVFVDITCRHCTELARDLDTLNGLGIRVRLLAYPLTGPNSPAGKRMADVWCAADKKAAFLRAVRNEPIPPAECVTPIVPYHYALGRQLGIPGSPGIIAEDGQLMGYLPPSQLVSVLKEGKSK